MGKIKPDITLREVVEDDSINVFTWRNDPMTRKQSFNDELVTMEEHDRWFKRALKDHKKVLYIGVDKNNNKYGIVRLDIKNNYIGEININVAPEKRGKGIGTIILLKSLLLFFSQKKVILIMARVKEENISSLNLFSKAGFFEMFRYQDRKRGGLVVLGCFNPHGVRNEGSLYGKQSARAESY